MAADTRSRSPYGAPVAYDEDLEQRVRALLGGRDVSERRMFGGHAFLVGGSMCVAAGEGGLMVRVDPGEAEALLQQPGVEQVVMGSRAPMRGWVRVDSAALAQEQTLDAWVQRGVTAAASRH